jgi:hypothetical protein
VAPGRHARLKLHSCEEEGLAQAVAIDRLSNPALQLCFNRLRCWAANASHTAPSDHEVVVSGPANRAGTGAMMKRFIGIHVVEKELGIYRDLGWSDHCCVWHFDGLKIQRITCVRAS